MNCVPFDFCDTVVSCFSRADLKEAGKLSNGVWLSTVCRHSKTRLHVNCNFFFESESSSWKGGFSMIVEEGGSVFSRHIPLKVVLSRGRGLLRIESMSVNHRKTGPISGRTEISDEILRFVDVSVDASSADFSFVNLAPSAHLQKNLDILRFFRTSLFKRISLKYFGVECGRFLTRQLKSGVPDSVNLYGRWPLGVKDNIEEFLLLARFQDFCCADIEFPEFRLDLALFEKLFERSMDPDNHFTVNAVFDISVDRLRAIKASVLRSAQASTVYWRNTDESFVRIDLQRFPILDIKINC
ncbi:hypothetical protein QR680_018114 [Steinernema hermaphroditum]|uniref:F-box domain-containing protein n=1 Tax=Steinernema hermaphroditum TaxID=289476 RepID=A0AA39HGX5_9BILA|nr:hypothetical protein QR680_018114 [Steinernema hermaphroditum]